RAVKVMKLLAASALLCRRSEVIPSDLWVLRYVWDREEQIDPLTALVNGILEQHAQEKGAHPLAAVPERVDGEDLARQLDDIGKEIESGRPSLTTLARLRERVAELSDRAAWVPDEAARKHLLERTGKYLEKLK